MNLLTSVYPVFLRCSRSTVVGGLEEVEKQNIATLNTDSGDNFTAFVHMLKRSNNKEQSQVKSNWLIYIINVCKRVFWNQRWYLPYEWRKQTWQLLQTCWTTPVRVGYHSNRGGAFARAKKKMCSQSIRGSVCHHLINRAGWLSVFPQLWMRSDHCCFRRNDAVYTLNRDLWLCKYTIQTLTKFAI